MKFLAEALLCVAKYRDPRGGSSSVSQKRCPRRSQPAAHTHSGTVSVRVPHLPSATPNVAILPSRRAPDRHAHAVLLCVPAPRIASVRRNPPFPRPVLANHFASAGVSNWGDRREIDTISPAVADRSEGGGAGCVFRGRGGQPARGRSQRYHGL